MSSRLSFALHGGAFDLPDTGAILALRPPANSDFGGLETARIRVIHGFFPEYHALKSRGFYVSAEASDGPSVAAIVTAQKARALSLHLLAQAILALPKGAPVIVDGAKTDGIEALLKVCRGTLDCGAAVSKAHGKVFAFAAPDAPPEGWLQTPAQVGGFQTRAGVFSADGVDPGSALLAQHLPPLAGAVCDLGAGWGYLAAQVLSPKVTQVDLVEAEWQALEAARVNVTDPRAAFHWADARDWTGRYDAVISNPPFHTGGQTTPSLGQDFIRTAARLLAPRGTFTMVANRHLPYEKVLEEVFAESVVLADADGYKVISARKPRKG